MKNAIKYFGVIALVAVIGFSMAACGGDDSTTPGSATAPTAPQNFTADSGNQQATLSWTAPASNGGSAITKYEVSSDDGASWVDASSNNGHTFNGLTNGTLYTFKVRAINANGAGAAATATATPEVLNSGTPSVPQNFSAIAGDTEVTLSWTAPANEGDSAIIKYEVSSDDGATWEDADTNTGHTFTGLNNDTLYTFKVRAVNGEGHGATATITATPIDDSAAAPTAPQNFTATAGDKQVTLNWTAPTSDGGSIITKYEVSSNNGISWVNASSDTGHTFTSLTNGTPYTFKVRAVNAVDAGEAATTTATPTGGSGAPSKPAELLGKWEYPLYPEFFFEFTSTTLITTELIYSDWRVTNGKIEGYFYNDWLTFSTMYSIDGDTLTLTDLTGNEGYVLDFVRVSNKPSVPQTFTATPGDAQITLSWTAPANNGGSAIIRYEVSSNNGTNWTTASSNTSHTFSGLNNGTQYTFKVRAVNDNGEGAEASTTAAPGGVWAAVTDSKFGTYAINSVAYGGGKFVAVGNLNMEMPQRGVMATSSDGKTWAEVTSTFTANINSIAYGGGKFVAGGGTGFAGRIATSSNGETWAEVSNSTFGSDTINAIAYGGAAGSEKWVAVGEYGKIAYSSNGETWIQVTNSPFVSLSSYSNTINSVAYGNGKWVAVGYKGNDSSQIAVATSPDGETWTGVITTFNTLSDINCVAYGGAAGSEKWVAGGSWGDMGYSTDDGATWTKITGSNNPFATFSTNYAIKGIAYNGSEWVAVAQNGRMATSTNGTTWTVVANSTFGTTTINSVAYGGGTWVAVGAGGKIAYLVDE